MVDQQQQQPYTDRELLNLSLYWERVPTAQAYRLSSGLVAARSLLRRALATLQATEFPCTRGGWYYCPDCGYGETAGHDDSCPTRNTIAALEEALSGLEAA